MTGGSKSGGSKTDAPGTAGKGAKRTRSDRTKTDQTTSDQKSSPTKTSRTKSGSRKAGPLRNGGPKGSNPKGNGHAAQPGPAGDRKANRRSAARFHAVQALYQMDITGAGLNEVLAQFESDWLGREVEGEQYLPAEAAFFRDIVAGVIDVQRELDPRIDAALEATWPLKRIEVILRSVLRAGAYELEKRTDVPARVVVSEYVDVAHAFVDKTETGMVNAVLDRLARNIRAEEFR